MYLYSKIMAVFIIIILLPYLYGKIMATQNFTIWMWIYMVTTPASIWP